MPLARRTDNYRDGVVSGKKILLIALVLLLVLVGIPIPILGVGGPSCPLCGLPAGAVHAVVGVESLTVLALMLSRRLRPTGSAQRRTDWSSQLFRPPRWA